MTHSIQPLSRHKIWLFPIFVFIIFLLLPAPYRWWLLPISLLLFIFVSYFERKNRQSTAEITRLQKQIDQLTTIQTFTAALNAGQNIDRLQQILLSQVLTQFHPDQAIIALIEQGESESDDIETTEHQIKGWWSQSQEEHEPVYNPTNITLSDSDLLSDILNNGHITTISHNTDFHIDHGLAIPLIWGTEILGILLLKTETPQTIETATLLPIAQQTAVRLGTMTTRSRRARESTIQDERARIAIDLHDTVSQSLFGIVFTLDACLKFLPESPHQAMPELERALKTADAVRQEIRQSIHDLWPRNFTANRFEFDLRRYITDTLQAVELGMIFDIKGSFQGMSPAVRRSLYRICQESLNNIVHHADATEARICVDIYDQRVQLAVRDNGRGFSPQVVLNQARGHEQFGLRGIQERVISLNGSCDIFSQPDAGTSLIIDLPLFVTPTQQ